MHEFVVGLFLLVNLKFDKSALAVRQRLGFGRWVGVWTDHRIGRQFNGIFKRRRKLILLIWVLEAPFHRIGEITVPNRMLSDPITEAAGGGNGDAPAHQTQRLLLEDLTQRIANAGVCEFSPFDGDSAYDIFFDAVCRALHRTTPRHVIVIGEPGVGQQAAIIELARRGLLGRPAFLSNSRFRLLDSRVIPPGQSTALLQMLLGADAPGEAEVLCVDGISHLFRMFATEPVALRWILSRFQCRVVLLASPREFDEFFAGRADLLELFTAVHLFEPSRAVAAKIVRHFAVGLQSRYSIEITDDAIESAVALSDSHILHERLPHKAVSLLRGVCDDLDYERSQNGILHCWVTSDHVIAKISQLTGIPKPTLAGIGEEVNYHRTLGDHIVGQEHAIAEVATELGLIKAGMIDAGKPASVMMFIGQTGTGKTEMAKALAGVYSSSKRLKTFTLGNFSEPHSVSGIIGVPPGYVGHDQGGRLINELNADPYGVFLLDEADKAHPDVMQPFLNLFEEGWISDQKGNKAYANHAIFILTTNVGQRQIAEMCRSEKSTDEITSVMKDTLSRIRHSKSNRPVFTAEFLSRVKRIVVFRSLDQAAMLGICQRLIATLQEGWIQKRQKDLVVPESLIEAIGSRGFAIDAKAQGREGGRVIRKLIADAIEAPIQIAIAANISTYQQCRQVVLDYAPAPPADLDFPRLQDHVRARFV